MYKTLLLAALLLVAGSKTSLAKLISPECKLMKNELKANGGRAISCTRTRKRQLQLVQQMCGRPVTCARASMRSKHLEGSPSCACDFATRHKPKAGGKWLSNNRGHRGNHMSDTGK